jgi:hypothetical protein
MKYSMTMWGTTEKLMTLGHSGKLTPAYSLNFTITIGDALGCEELPGR